MRKRKLYGSIIFLAFALESFINEIGIEHINSEFDEIERMPTVKKWYIIWNLKSKSLFLKGKEPFQSIDKLFKLRNMFAHDKLEFKDIDSKVYREIRNINHKLVRHLYKDVLWQSVCCHSTASEYISVPLSRRSQSKRLGSKNHPVKVSFGQGAEHGYHLVKRHL